MLQIGRRNLSAYDRSLLALKLKPVIAEQAKKRQGTRTDKGNIVQKSARSRDEVAEIAGVSHDTIHKVEVIEVQIGRMLKDIPKATANQYTSANSLEHEKAKTKVTEDLGFSRNQVSQFQRMADHEQQVIADAVLDAEVRIGELMQDVPKATPNNNPYHENDSNVDLVRPKSEVIKEAGLNPKQVERFQWMTGPEQKSAGQNKTSVKLSKTGNYQFGCQILKGSREVPGLSAKGVSCKLTCSWSGKLVRACRV